jgi:hypothetical protein
LKAKWYKISLAGRCTNKYSLMVTNRVWTSSYCTLQLLVQHATFI